MEWARAMATSLQLPGTGRPLDDGAEGKICQNFEGQVACYITRTWYEYMQAVFLRSRISS